MDAGDGEGDKLKGDQDDGQVEGGLALPAQSAEVGLQVHRGRRAPLATPALQGVDGDGGVNGVEEGDGDQSCDEAGEGRDEGHGGVHEGLVLKLCGVS